METYSVLTAATISPEAMAEFIKTNGGHIIDQTSMGYGYIESGTAAVYVGLEDEKVRDWERIIAKFPTSQTWLKSVVLLTVSRREGSIELSFNVADKIVKRWNGQISWDGLDDWEQQYLSWQAAINDPAEGSPPKS